MLAIQDHYPTEFAHCFGCGPAKPRGSCLDAHEAFIVAMIGETKDITLNEMATKLRAERGLVIGRSALSAWLGGRGWTFKKRPHMHWSRNARIS